MNKIICLFLFLILFTSCKTSSKIVTTKSKAHSSVSNRKTSQLIDDIVTTATDNIGVRYKAAGTTSSGFDCSGLVYSTFSQYDIALPRTSIEQSKTGTDLGKNTNKAQKGDLIFFRTNNRSQINHVGIITEVTDDEIKFVHASTSKGVIISSTKQAYYQKTFAQINRVLE
ncbi:C40 family peptidase [Flavobacterium muglaense]|uniref:C40 family peptidase n=1 Tax=Flavobacterium muglaense TaxID=2764716 RepID=A0A923MX60_9FLAO|nr:C40 family peptidase [Flavobacterium muglaense]MBC5836867.1 C40 family peptidase [Flavobacterium muglaense]MBC5843396.1 C40 family peptidase [Flavobacterium muglaense]